MTEKKPPLGTRPVYVAAGERVHELAEAIVRNSGDVALNTSIIKQWAGEILLQCEIVDQLEKIYSIFPSLTGN